jgi:glycosyltransferase involved in cell wall biosynthesis
MKIAFIGQKGIPTKFGGIERYVEGISQNLVKQGHEVFVYTRPYYTKFNKKTWKGVNLISLPSIRTKHLDAISHVFLATIHALMQDYDVMHYQGVGPSLLSFIPRILKLKTEVIVTFHSLDRNHAKWAWLAKTVLTIGEWTACKFPHRTITVSKGLQQYCLKRYKTPTTYIPNGVYSSATIEKKSILKKYNIQEKKYFIVVTRFIKHKRVEDVIEAYNNMGKSDVKLVIVGDGSYTDSYAKKLHSIAKNENIIFTGWLSGDPLFYLISKSAAFLSASEDEGMPITVLEAMSLSVPVVLTDILGHRDALDGCFGYYFQTRDVYKLQKHMRYVLRYSDKVFLEAQQNQKVVRENNDWELIAKSLSDLYAQEFRMPKSWQTTIF